MPYEKDPNEIGALWIKQTRGGGEMLSGKLTIDGVEHAIVAFRNDRKTGKAPDWRVLKSVPRGEAFATPSPDRRRAPHNANTPMPGDDEIPF